MFLKDVSIAFIHEEIASVQFSSVTQLCPTLCDPMNCSRPGLPVHHQLPEFTQIHVHQVSDAIQPSHPLSSPSPPAPNPPSIRVFSNESTLCMMWPKYWVTNSQSLLKVMSTEPVISSNHLILCYPPPFLPSIFPKIRVFFNESALHIRQPKYWSFSFIKNSI